MRAHTGPNEKVPRNADLALLDAIDQADLVRRGEVTATELVETAISRIELLNPALNAVIFTSCEEALARGGKPTRRVAWEELHIC